MTHIGNHKVVPTESQTLPQPPNTTNPALQVAMSTSQVPFFKTSAPRPPQKPSKRHRVRVLVIGPSGRGKSTTINAVLGLDPEHPSYCAEGLSLHSITDRPCAVYGELSLPDDSGSVPIEMWDTAGCPLDTKGRDAEFSKHIKLLLRGTEDQIDINPRLLPSTLPTGTQLVIVVLRMDRQTAIGPSYAVLAEMLKGVPPGQCLLVLVNPSRPRVGSPRLARVFGEEQNYVRQQTAGKPAMPCVVFGNQEDEASVDMLRGYLATFLARAIDSGVPAIPRDAFKSYEDIDLELMARLEAARKATDDIELAKKGVEQEYQNAAKELAQAKAIRTAVVQKTDVCTKVEWGTKALGAAGYVGGWVAAACGGVILAPVLLTAGILSWLGGSAGTATYKMIHMSAVYIDQVNQAYYAAKEKLAKAEAVRANSNHQALIQSAQERVKQAEAAIKAWENLKATTSCKKPSASEE